jgi:hypothetical protein
VEDQAPKACPEKLARQTAEWVELYTVVPPPGWALPINATPTPVPDGRPMDLEIRKVVVKVQNGHVVGATGMKTEHLKGWLRNIKREEAVDGEEGAGSHWRLIVSLIQAVWECGTMPTQMSWMVIILLPKGGGVYCGIGLLDPMWKGMEKIMVAQFSVIELHDCLHGGLPCRGTGRPSWRLS